MFALVKTENVTNPQTGVASDVEVIKLFSPNVIFEDKFGTQHSPSTLLNWSADQKQDHGIYNVAYENRKDDRFYTVIQNNPVFDATDKVVKITYTSTPKELEDSGTGTSKIIGLKSHWVFSMKDTANKILANTDWMLVRKIERNVDIPANIVSYRASVVAESNRLETAILGASDVEELISAVKSANWPAQE